MSEASGPEQVDITVIGAGAAGLFAALHAARTAPGRRVVAVDGARTLGAKILVAGGGRCNVTHHEVSERDYHGSSRNAVRNVLRRFGVPETVALFSELGVELKREETGKLFPTTDSARTVLAALLRGVENAGAEVRHPWRVRAVRPERNGYIVESEAGDALRTPRVVLAAGGRSLPKSGSDGSGEQLAAALGLPISERVFPALVPLTLPPDFFLCSLSGVAFPARLMVRSASGKTLAETTGAVLCTHFGVSGPGVLDISRRLLDARLDDAGAKLAIAALPGWSTESLDAELAAMGRATPVGFLKAKGLPERLAVALCERAGVDALGVGSAMRREDRRALVRMLTALELPVIGARGWNYAEVTAGGVPLSAVHLKTMEARAAAGVHLCGEVCDVDGRIGGFNFQWAWSSGFVAGVSAAAALSPPR